ncbi:hypothetical protein CJU89_3094 [Yarrowia sp. B02]|nr:hypothetical protein CJU89_3094 [Yarrowia sp. B02]
MRDSSSDLRSVSPTKPKSRMRSRLNSFILRKNKLLGMALTAPEQLSPPQPQVQDTRVEPPPQTIDMTEDEPPEPKRPDSIGITRKRLASIAASRNAQDDCDGYRQHPCFYEGVKIQPIPEIIGAPSYVNDENKP